MLHITNMPSLFSDDDGNIVYQQFGAHPRRPDHVSGLFPVPGWEAGHQWQGILKPHELVRMVNPSDGLIVSANNDVNKCTMGRFHIDP